MSYVNYKNKPYIIQTNTIIINRKTSTIKVTATLNYSWGWGTVQELWLFRPFATSHSGLFASWLFHPLVRSPPGLTPPGWFTHSPWTICLPLSNILVYCRLIFYVFVFLFTEWQNYSVLSLNWLVGLIISINVIRVTEMLCHKHLIFWRQRYLKR